MRPVYLSILLQDSSSAETEPPALYLPVLLRRVEKKKGDGKFFLKHKVFLCFFFPNGTGGYPPCLPTG